MSAPIDLAAERRKREEEREPQMWCCDCGCITFYHWSNGAVQCADCKTVQNGHEVPVIPAS